MTRLLCVRRTFGAAMLLRSGKRNDKYSETLNDSNGKPPGSFVIVRVDTNGIEHTMKNRYQTRECAERVADHYERLRHKNGYFVRNDRDQAP